MSTTTTPTREVEVGEVYTGGVTRLMNFGAFVEILPKKEGLVHISELAPYRVEKVEDVVKVGQQVTVKVIEIDELGRVNLSMRQAMSPDASPPPPSEHSNRSQLHKTSHPERRHGDSHHRGNRRSAHQ